MEPKWFPSHTNLTDICHRPCLFLGLLLIALLHISSPFPSHLTSTECTGFPHYCRNRPSVLTLSHSPLMPCLGLVALHPSLSTPSPSQLLTRLLGGQKKADVYRPYQVSIVPETVSILHLLLCAFLIVLLYFFIIPCYGSSFPTPALFCYIFSLP
ncbi:hypothetical protein BDV29DRAFT_22947 [Aspergillus leporis]|uniref:Uncharacterized protein n=1 Tax=Aspergillus leporis TaxID=41062 RepID=A0A5N5WRH5_9EURO|nr:hypothetical protein BDV29DRAFT_22947 [Aspergillus leporis]